MLTSEKKNRCVAIIQARMGSTRLKGKCLALLNNEPLLEWVTQRVLRAKKIDQCIVATTTSPEDDAIADFCCKKGVEFFRGSAENVLERYYLAAQKFGAQIIVRITADCPFIDPAIIDLVVAYYTDNYPNYDYVSNSLIRTFPRGLDVEVFSFKSLEIAYEKASDPAEKEHVTLYIYRHKDLFDLGNISSKENNSFLRITVDTSEDFELVNKIATTLGGNTFGYEEILELIRKHPEWLQINAHIAQKPI